MFLLVVSTCADLLETCRQYRCDQPRYHLCRVEMQSSSPGVLSSESKSINRWV